MKTEADQNCASRSAVDAPVADGALVLLLIFNLIFTPGFFHFEIGEKGYLSGSLIDILKNGSTVMLLSLGMTLVIATGGVDLSVGAVMAIAGAVAATLISRVDGSFTVAVVAALGVSLLAGGLNGLLVGLFRIQPIVATLVLMVAGRGVAQLITDGQIITFTDSRLTYVCNGHLLGLPFPVWIVAAMLLVTAFWTRRTAWGLFIESVGDNETSKSDSQALTAARSSSSSICFRGCVRAWRDSWRHPTSRPPTPTTPGCSSNSTPSSPWSSAGQP